MIDFHISGNATYDGVTDGTIAKYAFERQVIDLAGRHERDCAFKRRACWNLTLVDGARIVVGPRQAVRRRLGQIGNVVD